MQAIQVKSLPATDFKGTRVKAWIYGKESITRSFNYELDHYGNHCEVAYDLASKLGWNCKFVGGALPNGDSAFVIVEHNTTLEVK